MARILVVDDSKFERKKMADMLEKEDHDVIQASNGKKAVSKFRENNIDLVLLDIVMDKMNGIEALKKIIKEDENARVIMISGVGHEDTISNALDIGAKRYILKPVLRTKVIPTVNQVLGE